MSKNGEWWGMLGVQADTSLEYISYLFTSGSDCTKHCRDLPAILPIPASKSGPALSTSALMSKRFVAYLASFLGVLFYLK